MLASDSTWTVEYQNKDVEQFVLQLPPGLLAKYLHLTDLMHTFGADLGMPHTRAMSNGLFELRLRSDKTNARVFYCTLTERRIIMLHGFVKTTGKTPPRDLRKAQQRLREVKRET